MNHPDPSGRLGLVYFLFQESDLNMEKQRSVFLLHISGTKSLRDPQRPQGPSETLRDPQRPSETTETLRDHRDPQRPSAPRHPD